MSNSKFKPCKFCGSPARLWSYREDVHTVRCSDENCVPFIGTLSGSNRKFFRFYQENPEYKNAYAPIFTSVNEAAEAWNSNN